MDELALKNLISSLESSRSSLDSWLFWATLMVVAGVVLEVAFVIWEYREDLHDFRRGLVHPPERPNMWLLVVGLFGAGLVAIGVSGELSIGAKIGSVETKIRKANDDRASLVSGEAATAIDRAALNEREAAQLRKDAESEHLERVRLEAAVAPRSLSLKQQEQIRDACSAFRGHNVLVQSYGTDGEASQLGSQIIASLQATGINVADSRASMTVTGAFDIGVHVRGPDKERDFASCVGNALHSIGMLDVAINDPPPRLGTAIFGGGAGMGGGAQTFIAGTVFITIMVGVKPAPVLVIK